MRTTKCSFKIQSTPLAIILQWLLGKLKNTMECKIELINFFCRVSKEAKLELEEDEYVERFKPFMMDIVYEWTKGAAFKDIIKMTDMFEVFYFTQKKTRQAIVVNG